MLLGSDLLDFEVPEDTEVGTEVYTLRGVDPTSSSGQGRILYTISGDYFSVDQESGEFTTIQKIVVLSKLLFIVLLFSCRCD